MEAAGAPPGGVARIMSLMTAGDRAGSGDRRHPEDKAAQLEQPFLNWQRRTGRVWAAQGEQALARQVTGRGRPDDTLVANEALNHAANLLVSVDSPSAGELPKRIESLRGAC